MRAWEDFLIKLDSELGKQTVDRWLRSLSIICFDACNLYLEAKDSFIEAWFEEHIRYRVKSCLINNNEKLIKVHISVVGSCLPKSVNVPFGNVSNMVPGSLDYIFPCINEYKSFDSFYVSNENKLAYRLLKEICGCGDGMYDSDSSISSFNPIYIYGKAGSGKSHLLSAVASEFTKQNKRVLFLSANIFTEHVVKAIRSGDMRSFRAIYRSTDVLIVDEIDSLAGKNATQEEFFHTFNSLHLDNKIIILSSDKNPQELKLIEERLVSRFEWGMVILMSPLAGEDLKEFVRMLLLDYELNISADALKELVDAIGSNCKILVEAFKILQKVQQNNKGQFSIEKIKKYLRHIFDNIEKSKCTPAKIISIVAELYGLRVGDVVGKSHSRECVLPRQLSMFLCRDILKMPYMKIGDIFFRDHSTVMTSVKLVKEYLENDENGMRTATNNVYKKLDSLSRANLL